VAVADCCLFLKLELSPTPGLSIDCCIASSNFNRLLYRFIELERCLSTAGGYRTIHSSSSLVVTCCVSSNSSVASPLRAATKRFFHFLVVVCCLLNSSVASPLRAATERSFLVDVPIGGQPWWPTVHSCSLLQISELPVVDATA
jgi:hypothetical protein